MWILEWIQANLTLSTSDRVAVLILVLVASRAAYVLWIGLRKS